MKKLLGTQLCILLSLAAVAQANIKGTITDTDGTPLESASILLKYNNGGHYNTVTNASGNYFIYKINKGAASLSVSFISKNSKTVNVDVTENTTVNLTLEDATLLLEPLEVKAVRASDKAPFTKTNLSKEQIALNNAGQDLPFIINQTPSVVVNSDAGNGVGYTGIRIRGTDAQRTNMTIDGIPYNDAESQGLFFVNLPDVVSSTNSIQIQRGVGTSSNGAGAFGATLNLSTNEFNETAYAEINNSYGSFNTFKNTLKAGTGLINNHFTLDARLSNISSDGYIDRAWTKLRSYNVTGAYINKNTQLRLQVFSGDEKTYQAWNGVAESLLSTDRKYNSSGTEKAGEPYDNETDNYTQTHYRLFLNQKLSDKLNLSTALFLTGGKGYYEQYKADREYAEFGLPDYIVGGTTVTETDVIRQLWLDNYFYGQTFSLQYKNDKHELTLGGAWNVYDGDHYGKLIWASEGGVPKDYKWYDLDALKKDNNIYAKWQYSFAENFTSFADVQYRNVKYNMDGFRDNPTLIIHRKFDFINPKAGISYNKNNTQIYLSYALANKEPNRDDFEVSATEQPKHETLHDFELGFNKRYSRAGFGATAYFMNYKNQLVATGKINDVGAYTRVNVRNSYRMGLELEGNTYINDFISVNGNVTLSSNKIKNFTEFADDYDNGGQLSIEHKNKDISFSPAVTGFASVNFNAYKNLWIMLPAKYVGKQYLDNTQNDARSLDAFYLQDLKVSYEFSLKAIKNIQLIGQVNNVFNKKYIPNGYTFSYLYGGDFITENYYFPMAGTNYSISVNVIL